MQLDSPSLADGRPALRRVTPGTARSLLLTLLGECVLFDGQPVWTSSFLYVLGGLGIAEKSARQAIARATSAGWIESQRDGRRASWILTPQIRQFMEVGSLRVHSISRARLPWDGRWLVIFLTLPETQRATRTRVYRALQWAGFGSPRSGLWVTPHTDRVEEVGKIIAEMKLSGLPVAFTGPSVDFGLIDRELVEQSWDLDKIYEHYEMILDRFGKLRPQSDDSILFTHLQLVNAWQQLPFIDPGLPTELLPPNWNGLRAAARIGSLRSKWQDAARCLRRLRCL